ncbi:MAG: pyridoxal-phosphate dependent enzyme [Pseudomonadota bacterium]
MRHLASQTASLDALHSVLADIPAPSVDAARPLALLKRCPAAGETPLLDRPDLAAKTGAGAVYVKDERDRMGLGSFKALGAAYVIARDAEAGPVTDRTYVTASAGNHGMSVAAGARAFGAKAVIYIAETVPAAFAKRLEAQGATVRREGAIYEESMAAAAAAADANGWDLLSDSSWSGYFDRPWTLMEGYLVLMAEAVRQMPAPPTHIFLQAGVGGLAAACAAYARVAWGPAPRILIVEPDVSAPIFASAKSGRFEPVGGASSAMGRLDCKEASLIALKGLAKDASDLLMITEAEGATGAHVAKDAGLPSTPSGAAGLAGLLAAGPTVGISDTSRVLLILSEGPEA